MSNYYEILKLEPSASVAEIESSYENLYNQWRRLVTHHDPNVVAQANNALLTLEQVRATLTDPTKRSVYDSGLGFGQSVGGIADPSAVLKQALPPPPPPARLKEAPPSQVVSVERVDAWICPKCKTPNAIGISFCKKCGQALSRNCPKCNSLMEITAQFCPACGKSYEEAQREREMEDQRLAQIKQQEAERLAAIGPMREISAKAWKYTKIGWGLLIIYPLAPISVGLWIYSFVKARDVLTSNQIYSDPESRETATKARTWSMIPLSLVAIGMVIGLCVLIASGIGSIFAQ